MLEKELALINSLKKPCKPVMIVGDNTYYRDNLLRLYAEKNLAVVHNILLSEYDVASVENEIRMKSLTCESKILIINYVQKDMSKKTVSSKSSKKKKAKSSTYDERIIESIEASSNNVTVFFIPDKQDKRKTIEKFVEKSGVVVELKPVDEKTLLSFVDDYMAEQEKNGIDIIFEKSAKSALIELLHADIYSVKNELDKLLLLNEKVTEKIVRSFVTKSSDVVVYELMDAIAGKNKVGALRTLSECSSFVSISEFQILALLGRGFRILLYAVINQKEFAQQMKLPPFLSSKYLSQSKKFKLKQIKSILRLLVDAEIKMKSGYDKDTILVHMIYRMCEVK